MVKLAEDNGCFHVDPDIMSIIQSIADKYCGEDETVYVGVKGAFKEYLVASDKKVYIYKTGFMTGNTFGFSIFQLDYNSVSAIQLHTQLGEVGYIEIVGIGMQNKGNLSYWKSEKENSPSHQDNCLSFAGRAEHFEIVVSKLHELMSNAKNSGDKKDNSSSLNKFEEIKQYKELLDLGIISEDEFEKKKNELLNS